MAHHGVLLENEFEDMYQMFATYFNNPIMEKTKDNNNHSFYMCKTYCLLSTMCRYIIAIIPINKEPIGTQRKLNTLPWVCIQTRTLPNQYNVSNHSYNASTKSSLNIQIERIKITEESSIYKCDQLPISITLLHTNKNTPMSYQNKGTIIAALETYETIIVKK